MSPRPAGLERKAGSLRGPESPRGSNRRNVTTVPQRPWRYSKGPLLFALLLLGTAASLALALGAESFGRLWIEPLAAAGWVVLALCLLNWLDRPRPWAAQLSLALASLGVGLAALEGLGRLAGVDFHKLDRRYRALAPFYRKPDLPTGEGLWRRAGPLSWRGQVLRSGVRAVGLPDDVYRDEAPLRVRHDREGFRNESRVPAWEVAVAGDSFTELGHLPYAELFTSHLARRTGWRVRNLGVSHTGPLSHLHFLQQWGVSPATRHLIIAFYEGNDWEDLSRELLARQRYREGRPLPPDRPPQPSLLLWAVECLMASSPPPPTTLPPLDSWIGPEGDGSLTCSDLPPAMEAITSDQWQALREVLTELARLAERTGSTPWLAYLPTKRRVLHGRLRFHSETDRVIRDWKPPPLPDLVQRLCAETGVRFVDLTPPLRASCLVPFNALFDTHLNGVGSQVVGETLARVLPGEAPPARSRENPRDE